MATSSRRAAAVVVLAVALGGCGTVATVRPAASHPSTRVRAATTAFGWLSTGPAPASWSPAGTVVGGALPRPPGWHAVRSDPGSVSFAELAGDAIVGYLNATPRSGGETLANWPRFRPEHNAEEGDRDVRTSAAATGLRIGAARASCVSDEYRTSRSRYRELACLITRSGTSTVTVGAAPPGVWSRQLPIIERAIAGFVAS
ncbi:MAG: hypothetical protein JOZ64_09230 [Solirubrobacterales bacterium]|nr:hypothetical protein [Solirubrobacterales bacterium]